MTDTQTHLIEDYPQQEYWLQFDAGPSGRHIILQHQHMLGLGREKPTRWKRPGAFIDSKKALTQLDATATLYRSVMGIRYGIDGGYPSNDGSIVNFQSDFLMRLSDLNAALTYLREESTSLTDAAEARWLDVNLEGGLEKTSQASLKMATTNPRLHDKTEAAKKARLGTMPSWVINEGNVIENRLEAAQAALARLESAMASEQAAATEKTVGTAPPQGQSWCADMLVTMRAQLNVIQEALPGVQGYINQSDERLKADARVFDRVDTTQAAAATGDNVVQLFPQKDASRQ